MSASADDGTGWLGIGLKGWTLAVVGAGTFMSALDTSIVNVALPVIRASTHASVSTVEWVLLAYLVTASSALLLFGRLADLYGRRRLYLAGLLVFVAGSLACGLSGHIGGLIASRAAQGIGAAMIFALGPAILISAFPAGERGRALGLQATLTYLGLTLGPGLGGLLLARWDWPAIFLVNVPIGLAMAALAAKTLRDERREGGTQTFDPAGAATMALALAATLLVLNKGGDWGWSSPWVAALAALAVAAGATFVAVERRAAQPALDLALFLDRDFSVAVLSSYLCYVASAAVSFLMPFFLLHACGYAPPRAGAILMAVPLVMMGVTGPSGWLSDRIGVRAPATLGLALLSLGVGLLSRIDVADPAAQTVALLACIGLGAGLFTAPNNSAIMGAVPASRRGVAGAVLSAARTVGFASGVALAGLAYTHGLTAGAAHPSAERTAHAVRSGLRVTAAVAVIATLCSCVRGSGKTAGSICGTHAQG